jgi:hypothetical protein
VGAKGSVVAAAASALVDPQLGSTKMSLGQKAPLSLLLDEPVFEPFQQVIDDICEFQWEQLTAEELLRVALAYYYFSVQFRENLELVCNLRPDDLHLKALHREECNTANLSPWPKVAAVGEAMNHDEFMRRLLALQPIAEAAAIERVGMLYLAAVRRTDGAARAKSIASYEDGGLFRVFSAMLRAPVWEGDGQQAFRHFLAEHVKFDSAEADGHGALSRHIPVDETVAPLWIAFRELLRAAVPVFGNPTLSIFRGTPQPAE